MSLHPAQRGPHDTSVKQVDASCIDGRRAMINDHSCRSSLVTLPAAAMYFVLPAAAQILKLATGVQLETGTHGRICWLA